MNEMKEQINQEDSKKQETPEYSSWFTDMITTIDMNEVGEHCSRWGNTFATITKEHLEALRQGKVIYVDDGEYCHFMKLQNGD